jgi:hypothetical protein
MYAIPVGISRQAFSSPEERASFPPPVTGLNATSALMGMRISEAVTLENFIAYPDRLDTRPGFRDWVTGFTSTPRRLFTYTPAGGTEKMFLFTDAGIHDVTTEGVLNGSLLSITDGRFTGTMISTGAGTFFLAVNGVDSMVQYNGTTWSSISTLGTVNTSEYSFIELYRQRIYLVKKNSLDLAYLPPNSISGTPVEYKLGAIFRRGGKISAIGTWTIDSGVGPDDHLAVITSEGEVAVFTGQDPASLATWVLRGVYFIGKPLGTRPMYKYGGDLLIICENGVYPLSAALQSVALERQQPLTERVRNLFNQYTAACPVEGDCWQVITQPDIPLLILNIPNLSGPQQQLVQHLQTGAWSVFTGIPSTAWVRKGQQLFFADRSGRVCLLEGANDAGEPIEATLVQAYTRMSKAREKMVKLVRPYINSRGGFFYTMGMASDFNAVQESTNPRDGVNILPGIWGQSKWNDAYWAPDGFTIKDDWFTVPDEYSTWKAFGISIKSNAGVISYLGCDLQLISES